MGQLMVEDFKENFDEFINKKIVLCGAGRNAVKIIQTYCDVYSFIGVIDRDPENIGKDICGVSIISMDEAEKDGDLIIICTNPMYWNVIYDRIKDTLLPIYYLDGTEARKKTFDSESEKSNEYWKLNIDHIRKEIDKSEVISFDFFDTLFVRRVVYPTDVFTLIGRNARDILKELDYESLRREARECLPDIYTLEELYQKIKELSGISDANMQYLIELEMALEKKLLRPRDDIFALFRELTKAEDKELYIVSDMYMPSSFYVEVLNEYGVCIDSKHILISGECGVSKHEGSLWGYYKNNIVRDRDGLHIGDDATGDFEKPKSAGINAIRIWSTLEMLRHSNIRGIEAEIRSVDDSLMIGTALAETFNSPFALSESKGAIRFESFYSMGYEIFGMVIHSFLTELLIRSRDYRKIIFCSRDGYFLQKDFRYLQSLIGTVEDDTEYLYLSRQFLGLITSNDEEDLKQYIEESYKGTFTDYMLSRFYLKTDERTGEINDRYVNTADGRFLSEVMKYKEEIDNVIKHNLESYKKYLSEKEIDDDCLFVDVGYYGHTVYYLSKLLNKRLQGLFFIVNKDSKNICTSTTDITGSFQHEEDKTAHDTGIYRKGGLFDAYLTSPDGMFIGFDENGKFKFSKKMHNQNDFAAREEINQGVLDYIKTVTYIAGNDYSAKPLFADKAFKKWFETGTTFGDKIKESFYFDNVFSQNGEYQIL